MHEFGGFATAPCAENGDEALAVGAIEPGHVFHQSGDVQLDFLAKIDGLAHIGQGHFLRRGDDDGFGVGDDAGDAQGLVAGSRRQSTTRKSRSFQVQSLMNCWMTPCFKGRAR